MFGRRREYRFYREKHPLLGRLRRFLSLLLILFLSYEATRFFLVQTYRVDSISMLPSYAPGDRILASPIPYGIWVPFSSHQRIDFSLPRRGDVVILSPPYHEKSGYLTGVFRSVVAFFTGQQILGNSRDTDWNNPLVLKRIAGLPGDTIKVRDFEILIKPKGTMDFVSEFSLSFTHYLIQKDPLPSGLRLEDAFGTEVDEIQLKDDEYFVVSDNRIPTLDSRTGGPVKRNQIRAKVLLTYWPLHGQSSSK